MSWARLDDEFDGNKKMLALGDGTKGDARRWTWTRVLLYTARHESAQVPWNLRETIPRATRAFLEDCVQVGLLDPVDKELRVHDWELYADVPIRAKVAYYLGKFPDASANEVMRAVPGTREIVLSEVKRFRDRANQEPEAQYDRTTTNDTEPGTESGSRRPEPVPSRSASVNQQAALATSEPAASLEQLLEQLGVSKTLALVAMAQPDRAHACALEALRRGNGNPAGLFRRMLEDGDWPQPPPAPKPACSECGVGSGLHVSGCSRQVAA